MGNCENVCLAWPLAQHILTQGWFYNDGTKHNGIDLRAPEGTPVYAAENGTVMNVHQWNGIRTVGDTNSYGNMIKLGHSGEMDTLYANMSRLLVVQGQQVTQGQQIGVAGNTGNSFGSHLHFEVWSKGKRCNPLCFWTVISPKQTTLSIHMAPGNTRRWRQHSCAVSVGKIPAVKCLSGKISAAISGRWRCMSRAGFWKRVPWCPSAVCKGAGTGWNGKGNRPTACTCRIAAGWNDWPPAVCGK